jgi:hypothetical protein
LASELIIGLYSGQVLKIGETSIPVLLCLILAESEFCDHVDHSS